MLRHIVMFKFQDFAEGGTKEENIKKAKKLFESLDGKVEVIRHLQVGLNSDQAPEKNYDLALICDFDNFEDQQVYQNHPAHLEVAAGFIRKVIEERACIDFEF